MGAFRLKVNVARYAVENSGLFDLPEVKTNNYRATGQVHGGRPFSLGGVRSYSDVVGKSNAAGGSDKAHDVLQMEEKQETEKYIVVPDRTGAFRSMIRLALVGRTMDLETLVDFDRLLSIAKILVANIQYLGGLSLLISFHDEVSANQFLETEVIWGPWFSKLEPWKGQTFPLERDAWLRLNGIPLHLFDPEVLVQISEIYGKVLHVPKFVEEDNDLSVCRVGVLSGESGRIKDSVLLR
ncbi:hypothetical protein Hdeb2414_s0021g00576911 [Helianthus debilis subsp. tardiflorus]